jgi:hypothetical protein
MNIGTHLGLIAGYTLKAPLLAKDARNGAPKSDFDVFFDALLEPRPALRRVFSSHRVQSVDPNQTALVKHGSGDAGSRVW